MNANQETVLRKIIYLIILSIATAYGSHCFARPIVESIQYGDVKITYSDSVTRIHQKSQHAVVLWKNFDIGTDERLEIIQPSQNARLINRVSLRGISNIEGNINSNGQLLILNADGIILQSSANAKVGGLILGGMGLRLIDHKTNSVRLLNMDSTRRGDVQNHGTIETAKGGNAVLVGKKVLNQGLITGELSSISLAVGLGAALQFERTGLVNVNIVDAEAQLAGAGDPALQNVGEIIAPSGRILLTGSKSSRVFKQDNGRTKIALAPGAKFNFGIGAHVVNYGRLDVSGVKGGSEIIPIGGQIAIIGDTVENYGFALAEALRAWNDNSYGPTVAGQILLAASKFVNSSWDSVLSVNAGGFENNGLIRVLGKNIHLEGSLGAGGAGEIQIGGKGTGINSELTDTERTFMDVWNWGDEGFTTAKFGVWAKEDVELSGEIYAQSRFGGAIEIISGNRLKLNALISASNSIEERGTALLQARDILVAFKNEPWSVDVFNVSGALAYAKVTIKAERNLTVVGNPSSLILGGTGITVDHMTSLSLIAGNDLRLEKVILNKLGELTLSAGNDIYISNLAASTTPYSPECYIKAGRDAYLSNSIFYSPYWCDAPMPEAIQVGGELHIDNVLFSK